MIPTQKGAISSSQQRKLPRHYIPRETFLFELTHTQASTLNYLLPKGCSVVQQSKSKLKPPVIAKSKHQQNIYSNYYNTSSHHQERSSSKHHAPQSKQVSVPKSITSKTVPKKPHKQEIPQIVKPCIAILQQLKSYKHSWPFLEPVDAQALGIPEYYEIIAQPMDLSTAQQKLKSAQYKTPQQFYRDVNLMIKNSYVFNQANQEFLKITNDFEKYFWRIAGPQSKPTNDKKLEREKQKQRERLQRQRAKQEKLRQKMLQKEKQRQRKLLLQQQQQAQQALKLAKKKKKMIPKDILQAQNISAQEKQQLANTIHNLPKQHLKDIRQIVFSDTSKQQDNQYTKPTNMNEFDIQKIGYKKIRQLQKYVRVKLNEIENRKFTDQLVEKKNQVDLDMMESQCSEEFVQ